MQTYTLLTGASSGIGAAIAKRLGGQRALILGGRDADKLRRVAGERDVVWRYDLRDVEGIQASLAGLLEQRQAVIDCFVHCAGVVKVLPARLTDCAVVQEVMNVNVLSAVQIVRTLLKKQNHGALANVLFISSTYSIKGVKGQAIYSASKGALDALMLSLAVELAPAVRVNSVLPGGVKTAMSQRAFEDPQQLEKMKQEYLLRLGEVDDVVNAVEFMLSDKASWITGQKFVVDGGQTAHEDEDSMKDATLFRSRDAVTSSDLLRCLEAVGAGDCRVLYVHSEMSFGKPNPELGKAGLLQAVLDTLLELGVPTLCVPTFTFSFCNGVSYDVNQSRSKMGVFNEYIRRLPNAKRSIDPLMSSAVLGADHQVVTDVGHHSIGEGCTFDRLHAAKNARFLFLGVGAAKCFTYTHYVEERLRVPYRYDREFTGTITDGDRTYQDTYTLYVRYNGVQPESTTKFEDYLVRAGLMKKVACGDNFISSIAEPVAYETIAGKIREDGNYFLAAPYPPDRKDTRFEVHDMVAL